MPNINAAALKNLSIVKASRREKIIKGRIKKNIKYSLAVVNTIKNNTFDK